MGMLSTIYGIKLEGNPLEQSKFKVFSLLSVKLPERYGRTCISLHDSVNGMQDQVKK